MTEEQFGLWSAIAIHDTSSVVGAAHSFGDEALKIATTVKLTRVLWIIPLTFISAFLFKNKTSPAKMPWFILFFVAAICINTFINMNEEVSDGIQKYSKGLLVSALFLVGTGLNLSNIRSAGWNVLGFGLTLWVFISALSLLIIYFYI